MTLHPMGTAAHGALLPLGWALIHSLWQGLLVAALLATVLAVVPARSAGLRYGDAVAALAAMLLLSAVTLVHLAGAPRPGSVVTWRASGAVVQPVEIGATSRIGVGGPALARALPSLPLRGEWFTILPPLAAGVWVVGVSLLSLRLLGGWLWVRTLMSTGVQAAPAELELRVRELAARLAVHARLRVLVSSRITVPLVVGCFRAVILVPVSALAGLPPQHLEALLAHELAHVRRHDFLANLLQTLAETLFFYHPAAWWISRQIRREREHCCDDVAVPAVGDPLLYAHALLAIEELRPRPARPVLAASDGSLAERIRRLLRSDERTIRGARPACAAALGAALLLIAAALPRAQAALAPPTLGASASAAAPTRRHAVSPNAGRHAVSGSGIRVHRHAAVSRPHRRRAARKRTVALRPATLSRPTPVHSQQSRRGVLPARPASVEGQVTDTATGEPVEGVEVEGLAAAGSRVVVTTAADGSYALSLPPGRSTVSVLGKPVGAFRPDQRYRTEYRSQLLLVSGETRAVPFAVARDRLTWEVAWRMDPEPPLIPMGFISGRVVDLEGRPLPGLRISAHRFHPGWEGAVTAADGRFHLTVVAGKTTVSVQRETVWVVETPAGGKMGFSSSAREERLDLREGEMRSVLFRLDPEELKPDPKDVAHAEQMRRALEAGRARRGQPAPTVHSEE